MALGYIGFMTHDFWLERWDNGQLGWHRDQVHPDLLAHADWLLEEADAVLVPLCGKTRDLGWLAARARVYGAELSAVACEALFDELGVTPTRRQSGAHVAWSHGPLTVFQGDVLALTAEQVPGVGAIWDRGAMVALPLEMRQAYVPQLRTLMPRGRVLLNALRYNPCAKSGPPHSLSGDHVRALYADARVERVETRDESAGIKPGWVELGLTEMHVDLYRIERGA